jgi:photosystem II stability/assembly factor-like uncharacterized protein
MVIISIRSNKLISIALNLNKSKPDKMMKQLPSLTRKNLVLAILLLIPAFAFGQLRGNIITQPENASECEGIATVTFKITMARSLYGYLYEWQMAPYKSTKFLPVSEVTKGIVDDSKSTLTLEFNKFSGLGYLTREDWDRMQFRCVVQEKLKGALPETSSIAYLLVQTAPSIYKHPVSAEKNTGESVSFSISASGSTPRTYQWQHDDGGGYVDIPGATSTVYTIASVSTDDAGAYRCQVTNPCDTRTSSAATLTVNELFYEAWVLQTSNTLNDIKKVSFTSTANGWAVVYDSDKLLHTSNGGETWTPTSTGLGSYTWYSINFPSASLGFVGTYGSIGRTENGGSSWERYYFRDSLSLSTSPWVYDMFFLSTTTGWAVGADGLILKTTDGGDSWMKQNFNGDPTLSLDINLYGVYFADASNGWVVGDNGAIFHTTNGGSVWSLQTTPNTVALYDVAFTDASNGYAVGLGYRNLLVTSNGGSNWSLISSTNFPNMYPYAVHFENASDGWVAGYAWISGSSQGIIARTNDGGATWHQQYVEGGDVLQHLDFVDSENGWAVGSSGTIVRTGTGGCFLPTVNLYGDEALCASESYTMRADTFAKNLNCSYLWSTGATTGALTVSASDDYSVVVTSLCGETAEDSKTLEFYTLPEADAGVDTFMCFGDTIQLIASGGVLFSWSPTGTLSDPGIQNPMAFPSTTTKYYVTVTDTNGCSNVDNMNLTVYPIPTSTFSSPAFVCGTDAAAITYTGSASAGGTFTWDFDGGTNVPAGEVNNVSWAEIGDKTVSLVVEENTCVSDTTWQVISVNPIPLSTFTLPAAVCNSEEVDLVYDGTDSVGADYVWDFDGGVATGTNEGPYKVSWSTEGTKTVSLTVTQDGCVSGPSTNSIYASYPYEGSALCLVSVDTATGKNAIIWEKEGHTGVEFYKVYRESNTGGVYDEIATLPADTLSYYVDETSEPTLKSHKYKVSAIDTCGYESEVSLYHKTMLLTTGLGTDRINVSWTEYEVENTGFGFVTYIILRGPAPDKLRPIDTIPADNILYPDINPPAGDNYYLVAGVIADPCSPTGNFKAGTGPYHHSLSNMDDNKLKVGVEDVLSAEIRLRVFPNPFQDKAVVEYQLLRTSEVKIEVYNLLGVRVLELENNQQSPGAYQYDIPASDLDGSTIYYLRFNVDGMTTVKKLVPSK